MSDRHSIFDAALALPAADRTELIERLLESLDQTHRREIDDAWADEAERRLSALDSGEVEAVPGEAVLRRLRGGQRP